MGKKVVSVTFDGSTHFDVRYEGGGSKAVLAGHNAKLVQYSDDGISYIDENGRSCYYDLNRNVKKIF